MQRRIEIRQKISGDEGLRFQCDPGLAKRWPALARFAERVGVTRIAEIAVGALTIYAKMEWENPGQTVKDRAVLGMLHTLLLQKNPKHILEYTGGSLGTSLASLCHDLRLPLTLILSQSTPRSVIKQLEKLDCELDLIDKHLGFWGVMQKAIQRSRESQDYSFLFQHENVANPEMHLRYTGNEFLQQLEGADLDGWVAAVGTGGTYCGVLTSLRARHPTLPGFVVTPSEMPYGTEVPPNPLPKFVGAGGLGYGKKQKFVSEIDPGAGQLQFSYDECRSMMLGFYRQTGVMIGSSAAANILGCLKVHEQFGLKQIATVFPSRPSFEESQWLVHNKETNHDQHRAIIEEGRSAAFALRP